MMGPFSYLRVIHTVALIDTDLSLAFAWRYWHLLRMDGRAGVVLPRGILGGRAAAQWRIAMLDAPGRAWNRRHPSTLGHSGVPDDRIHPTNDPQTAMIKK
jgi:hypothetical protein